MLNIFLSFQTFKTTKIILLLSGLLTNRRFLSSIGNLVLWYYLFFDKFDNLGSGCSIYLGYLGTLVKIPRDFNYNIGFKFLILNKDQKHICIFLCCFVYTINQFTSGMLYQ